MVVIELVRYPTPVRDGEGVIVDVLGERGRPGIDTLSVIRQFNLPDQFPEEVLTDARREVDRFTETIEPPRRDLTSHTIVTIDPWDARDFDDAISLERTSNGHWLLGVHIADVSHFVRSQTAIDTEAYRRGNSVYLPDRVLPMLPELISNNLASLQPERVRFTMTALIELDADGVVISTEFFRSAIRSAWRFNYEEIDQYLADDAPWRARLPADVFRLVRDMHNLAMVMRRRRMRRGAFDLILPEIKIDLDDDGRVKGAHLVENTESHQVIEEFMLAANEAVAQWFVDHDQVFLRRIHLPPSEVKLRDLKMFLTDLGIPCQDLSSRFEINRVLAASRDLPERDAVHFAILRSMQKAIYSPRDEGHYALASSAYLHFTSPIRRYPDLVIHRMLGAMIDGQRPKTDVGQLLAIGLHTSDTERRAEEAERDLIKLKLLNFLHDKIGSQWDAVVTGVESFGLFAQGIELPAEGFIPIESLPPDNYYYDRGTRTLAGHRSGNSYRLGDPIRVRISHVDPDRRELDFELIGRRRPGETTSHAGETTAAESRPPHRQRRRAATSSRGASRESASSRRSRSRPAKAARTKPPERQRKSKKAAPPATDKRRGSAKRKPKERGGRGSRQRD
jgi:ribonuclease R